MTEKYDTFSGELGGEVFSQGSCATPAIPPVIAQNLLEFMRRVQSTGMEAVAWVQAYQFVQQYAPQQPLPMAAPK